MTTDVVFLLDVIGRLGTFGRTVILTEILGATVVARHAGEMLHGISLAMVAGIGLRTVARDPHLSDAGRGDPASGERLHANAPVAVPRIVAAQVGKPVNGTWPALRQSAHD